MNETQIARISQIPQIQFFSICVICVVCVLIFLTCGCASEALRDTERYLSGRWTGDPLDPPAKVWWEHAGFDVSFGGGGDFTVVAKTFAKRPYELHFDGAYDVTRPDLVRVDERDLGGEWSIERDGPEEMRLTRGDLALRLRRRHGS